MAKQSVRVHIFNQSYSLLTEGDPQETIELAERVDRLMTSIANRSASGDAVRAAVLASLHLADQLRDAERRLQAYEDRSTRISSLLEEALEQ
jgi:cell division protein ZapA (FtsZ GTPase activity inhibitor)